ncbi:MAG: hypothetical protein AAB482_03225, partial [Patescibacteria group bacterium]
PNGEEIWAKGSMQTIKWQDNTPIPICPVGAACMPQPVKYYDIKLVTYYSPCSGNVCPLMPYVRPYMIASGVYRSAFEWRVDKVISLTETPYGASAYVEVPDGPYTVQVCVTGSVTCDSSDSYFKIVSAP